MIPHPFINDLSGLTLEELGEKISNLNKQLSFMSRMNKPEMVGQIQMALVSYRAEYLRRQQELWDKKPEGLDKKINIG
jgi:hypothetical protein